MLFSPLLFFLFAADHSVRLVKTLLDPDNLPVQFCLVAGCLREPPFQTCPHTHPSHSLFAISHLIYADIPGLFSLFCGNLLVATGRQLADWFPFRRKLCLILCHNISLGHITVVKIKCMGCHLPSGFRDGF